MILIILKYLIIIFYVGVDGGLTLLMAWPKARL
jgi:hypothetical protein